MQIDHDAMVLVADGRKLLFFRNKGDRAFPQLEAEEVKVQDDPADRDQASDAPGRAFNSVGSHRSSMEQTDFHELEEARFAVEDWNHALQSLITYAATAILSERDFQGILHDRTELGERLLREVAPETERWGVAVERAFVRNVNLLPEVARHVFQTVATRIERAKAVVEERGHIDAARIEADADLRCAAFVAEAKAQYPLAVGRGLAALRADPKVYAAYQALYALAQVRPARTVTFLGFDEGSPRAVDAAMLPGVTEAMSGPARLDG